MRRKLGCPESAADLAQDTFIRVLSARETPTLIEPRAFLTTVAKRVLCNFYRRQDLERAYLDALAQLPEHVAPSEEERAIILQTLVELDQLLDGLPTPSQTRLPAGPTRWPDLRANRRRAGHLHRHRQTPPE